MPTEPTKEWIPKVNLRPETDAKWRQISASRRWTRTETADALADFYIEHNDDLEPVTSQPSTSEN